MLVPLLLYLEERGLRRKWQLYVRDSLLTILWALFFTLMLGYPVTVAARLGMGIGLQDAHFIQWDGWLGVNQLPSRRGPPIIGWEFAGEQTYNLLFPYMRLAILLPVFAGKIKYAQKFLIRLASETELMRLFPDCELGAMPPFGDGCELPVIVDAAIAGEFIAFTLGTHKDIVRMSFADFQRIARPKVGAIATGLEILA